MVPGAPEEFCQAKDSRHFSEKTGKVIDVILKTSYCQTCSNIKAQKDASNINILEYLEKSAKHGPKYLLNCDGLTAVSLALYILFVVL